MSDPKPFDPFDPVSAAMGALHNQNLAAAAEARAENQAKTISEMRYAGNELARVMEDILGSGMITCQISRAVMTATVAKWKSAKTGQL
jgi:hypothetical protein